MMPLDFDELNKLVGFGRSMPFTEYFGEMVISPEQRRKRRDLADDLDDGFIDILAWVFYTQQNRKVSKDEVKDRVKDVFNSSLGSEIKRLEDTDGMVDKLSDEIARTTVDRGQEDPFFLSADRSRLLAEDNSNNFWNYAEFDMAVSRGMKYKTWNTILDGRERITHNIADGQMQPIMMPFEVGSSLLMYPKDMSLDASLEEIIQCRCSVSFS